MALHRSTVSMSIQTYRLFVLYNECTSNRNKYLHIDIEVSCGTMAFRAPENDAAFSRLSLCSETASIELEAVQIMQAAAGTIKKKGEMGASFVNFLGKYVMCVEIHLGRRK